MNRLICLMALSLVMGMLIGAAAGRCPEVPTHQSIFVTDKGTVCLYGDKAWVSPTPELCQTADAPK